MEPHETALESRQETWEWEQRERHLILHQEGSWKGNPSFSAAQSGATHHIDERLAIDGGEGEIFKKDVEWISLDGSWHG